MKPTWIPGLILGLTGLTVGARAENLADVYARALVADPKMREAEALHMATRETRTQALLAMLPINANASQDWYGIGNDSGSAGLLGTLSLNVNLFSWNDWVNLKQANAIVAQGEANYLAAQHDLIARVAQQYFAVLAAQDTLATQESALQSVSRQLEQTERRFEVGLIAITDVQQAQAGYDTAVATEISAQQTLATAHEFLREIIGEDFPKLAGPKEDFPLRTPDPQNQQEWVQRALSNNLTLNAQRIALDVANEQISIDRGSRLPKLTFSAGYSNQTTDTTQTLYFPPGSTFPSGIPSMSTQYPVGNNWSLNLTFPLYTGGANSARIQTSVYNARLAMQTVEQITRQTERQTRDAFLTVISDISRVRALKQSVESNRTALRATEAGFEVGTQTTVDVLVAQNALRLAETDYAQSRYAYLLAAMALKQASGSLNEQDVMEVDSFLQQ
jgi:outer membrane protein